MPARRTATQLAESALDHVPQAMPGRLRYLSGQGVAGDNGAVGRKRQDAVGDEADPEIVALRQADAEYHRLCIDIQEPCVPRSELPLEELALAVERLAAAI